MWNICMQHNAPCKLVLMYTRKRAIPSVLLLAAYVHRVEYSWRTKTNAGCFYIQSLKCLNRVHLYTVTEIKKAINFLLSGISIFMP